MPSSSNIGTVYHLAGHFVQRWKTASRTPANLTYSVESSACNQLPVDLKQ